jgi:hypothetical protein
MAIEDELLAEIQSTLGSAITPSLRRSDPSGIFEGYILSLVLRAAVRMGASNPILYEDINGNMPTIFEFRTSPGYIASIARPYTYAIIEFPNKPVLEAHIGVLVEGESGVLHECDVAVITREEAARCRRESQLAWSGSPAIWISPNTAKIVLSVECKFYQRANLGIDLARSFLGLTFDMSAKCIKYFVTSTSSNSVDVLLNSKGKSWYSNILPGTVGAEMLQSAFQKTFENFITSRRW